ncbi:hypothetical protein [Variovorax sp. EBFNA2]|uniref:hypothetical protein n=1 Tax=Variovorax sp. EBFNA2 TaxID=3342097 RepID=UPI0029C090B8|nr:hypothetical protein [Variovorax boronicumulans]WPG35968.1 hypothetical protein RZE79_21060 [Variovorax boronicumulans]
MAEQIIAGRSTPKSSRRKSGAASVTPTGEDARDLLEIKLAQLNSLLWCCYGDGNGWFEEAGEKHRDHMLWIAADLAREAERLLGESGRG